jgi:predicted metal-binding membrane protein
MRSNPRTFGFHLVTRLAIFAAVLAAVVLLAWPLTSSLWTDPGKKQGPDITLPGATPTTQAKCVDIGETKYVESGGRCVALCSLLGLCPRSEYPLLPTTGLSAVSTPAG